MPHLLTEKSGTEAPLFNAMDLIAALGYAMPSQVWMTGSQPPIKTMTIRIGRT